MLHLASELKQLDRAVEVLRKDFVVSVRWKPFELNPDVPKEGRNRREYRSAKFGSWEYSQRLDAEVAEAGRQAGLEFHHERMERTPNTFDAHRLIWLAEKLGVQDAVIEGLFAGYFTNGRDVGDRPVLMDIAVQAGLNRAKVEVLLAGRGLWEPSCRGFGVAKILKRRQLASPRPSFGESVLFSRNGKHVETSRC